MSEYYVGEIRAFSGNFAPNGWHLCDGTLLSLSTYQLLYAILGTTYGGNGTTTFGLPDLRGRTIVGVGQGTNLTNRTLGQAGGAPAVALTGDNVPPHSHPVTAIAVPGTSGTPQNNFPAGAANGGSFYLSGSAPNPTDLTPAADTVAVTGQGQAHANMMPSVAINYIIALNGLYPTPS